MANDTKTDFITDLYFQLTAFFEQNRNLVFGGASVIVLAIVGFSFWNQTQKEKNEEATYKLERIVGRIEAGDLKGAIEGDSVNIGLKQIVENYSGTPAGEKSKLYLANALFQKGSFEEAQKTYESISSSSPLVKGSAYAGVAVCYEQKKEFKKAAQYFQRAADAIGNDAITPIYLENAGRNFELAGEKSDALSAYEKLKKNYPQANVARNADQIIARLKK